eukprot:1870708-Pyramimonas_sp.AAC.2
MSPRGFQVTFRCVPLFLVSHSARYTGPRSARLSDYRKRVSATAHTLISVAHFGLRRGRMALQLRAGEGHFKLVRDEVVLGQMRQWLLQLDGIAAVQLDASEDCVFAAKGGGGGSGGGGKGAPWMFRLRRDRGRGWCCWGMGGRQHRRSCTTRISEARVEFQARCRSRGGRGGARVAGRLGAS